MKTIAYRIGIFIGVALILLGIVSAMTGCTEAQLTKSEQLRQQVATATTQPIPVAIESSVPYGPLAGAIGAIMIGGWGLLNDALRRHRNAQAKNPVTSVLVEK